MSARCDEVIREMRSLAKPKNLAGMARFGITTSNALGLATPTVRAMARRLCPGKHKDQPLAEELWQTGIRDARILATLIGDPNAITPSTMDRWAADLDCWSVCDACSCDLFDRTPYVWQKIPKWAADKREFVRRAAFSTLAGAAVHRKQETDQPFLDALPLIEKYAFDDRNFVRKAVNWALRNIGKRNARLLPAAIACAERVRAQNTRAARWIAADALREFRLKFGEPLPADAKIGLTHAHFEGTAVHGPASIRRRSRHQRADP